MNNEALNEWMENNTDVNVIQAKVDKVMTPKEKALELVDDMFHCPAKGYNEHKIECALIAVDEILSVIWHAPFIRTYDIEYWKEVKQELEKL